MGKAGMMKKWPRAVVSARSAAPRRKPCQVQPLATGTRTPSIQAHRRDLPSDLLFGKEAIYVVGVDATPDRQQAAKFGPDEPKPGILVHGFSAD